MGDFVVVWMSYLQDGSDDGIYGQLFFANGAHLSSEFQINTFTLGAQRYPSVAGIATGDFVVVWGSDWQDGSGAGIYGQRYSSSGIPQDSEFQVNTYTVNSQQNPSVAALSTGDFVVVWQSGDSSSGFDIYGQRFSSLCIPQGDEFQVNSTILNTIYEKMVRNGATEEALNEFARISPIAWVHILFTGRYSFKKSKGNIDIEEMARLLEKQLKEGFL